MTKVLAVTVGGLFVVMSVLLISNQFHERLDLPGLPQKQQFPLQEGKLPIARERFEPILEQARNEMRSRYRDAAWWHGMAQKIGWAGLILASIMTIVVGFYGGKPGPDGNAASALENILKEQGRSKGLIRLGGVLIALSTLPTLFSQRCEASAGEHAASARELNKVIMSAAEKLYSPETLPSVAERVLLELEDAVAQKW